MLQGRRLPLEGNNNNNNNNDNDNDNDNNNNNNNNKNSNNNSNNTLIVMFSTEFLFNFQRVVMTTYFCSSNK